MRNGVKIVSTGEHASFSFHDDVYGQCWTTNATSVAMWQIHSNKKNVVQIGTTVGKLISDMRTHCGEMCATCFIGKVDYLSKRDLREFSRTIFRGYISVEKFAQSLMVKRYPYRYEREVRIVYIEPSEKKHVCGICKYKIDPHALIDRVTVDPQMPHDRYIRFKKEIVKRTGIAPERIMQSLLYQEPRDFIVETD